eukprot:15364804-Ditylum_brightwellii.AAC.1
MARQKKWPAVGATEKVLTSTQFGFHLVFILRGEIGLSTEHVAELLFSNLDSNNNFRENTKKKSPDTSAAITLILKVGEEEEEQLETCIKENLLIIVEKKSYTKVVK